MNAHNHDHCRRHGGPRMGLFLALGAIAAGALILMFNTGEAMYLYKPLIFSWPMLLIVIGLMGQAGHRGPSFSALLVMLTGLFFLIPRLAACGMNLWGWHVPDGFARTWWPVLLIAAGLLWIICRAARTRSSRMGYCRDRERRYGRYTHSNFRRGEVNAVFGSGTHTILDPAFEGGEVNAVFGEVTLDLRKAGLPEGRTTTLEVNVVFGNAVIIVPESWNVDLHVTPVAGAFSDMRESSDTPHDMTRTLDIRVNSVFSGGELRNS